MILFSGRNKEKLNLTKPFVVPTTTRQSFSLKSLFSKKWKQALPKLVPAYTHKLPISSKKQDDLLKLCEDYAIPERYHHCYESLVVGGAMTPTFDEDEDEDDDMEPEEQ